MKKTQKKTSWKNTKNLQLCNMVHIDLEKIVEYTRLPM